ERRERGGAFAPARRSARRYDREDAARPLMRALRVTGRTFLFCWFGSGRVRASEGEIVASEWRSQRRVDAERCECVGVVVVECEPDETQPVGAQPGAGGRVEVREFGCKEGGVGLAALSECNEFVGVGGAAGDADRSLAAEQLLLDLPLGERCQSEQNTRLVVVAHGALTLGIGALEPLPLSR